MGFARFLISHIHLRFYMKNKLFTRSLVACAAAGTRNNERGGVGRNSFAVRFGGSYLHRVGLKSEHEKLDTYVAYRLDGDS